MSDPASPCHGSGEPSRPPWDPVGGVQEAPGVFRRTFLTECLKRLLVGGVQRISGKGKPATREYDRALAELLKGNLSDSSVLGLIAHTYQGKADAANAKAY